MAGPSDSDFLYVPEDEMDEAISLGAKMRPGEARLLKPRPIPLRVAKNAFDKWQTTTAKYRWCMRYIVRVAGGLIDFDDIGNVFKSVGKEDDKFSRVYLWVPNSDIKRVRRMKGVRWDGRVRRYYADPGADLNELFEWLTPISADIWQAEKVTESELQLLIQAQANSEIRRKKSAGDEDDISLGMPKRSYRKA